MGERRLAGRAAGRARARSRPSSATTDDDRHAARRAAGEPAPRAAEPARGGRGLPAAARGLRLHPRGAGASGSVAPAPRSATRSGCSSSAPAVQRRVAAGVLSAGPRPVPARRRGPRSSRTGWPPRVIAEGISVRGLEEIVAVGDTGSPDAVRRVPAGQADRAGSGRARRPALGPARDPGQGRPRPDQGPGSRWSSPASTTCAGSSTSFYPRESSAGLDTPASFGPGTMTTLAALAASPWSWPAEADREAPRAPRAGPPPLAAARRRASIYRFVDKETYR